MFYQKAKAVRWGPGLFFFPAVLIVIVDTILAQATAATYNCKATLSNYRHVKDSVPFDREANVSIVSHDEVFILTVTGQIRGPELKRLMRYFRDEYDPSRTLRIFRSKFLFQN